MENGISCKPYKSFAIVSMLTTARGYSLSDHAEAMTPIAGFGKVKACTTGTNMKIILANHEEILARSSRRHYHLSLCMHWFVQETTL
jgi:hypothetical protein